VQTVFPVKSVVANDSLDTAFERKEQEAGLSIEVMSTMDEESRAECKWCAVVRELKHFR
jgi:hypothetical protein